MLQAHRPEIGSGNDSEHTVFFEEIRQQQRLTFLREVSRKLFVISIHAFDNSIFATMQVMDNLLFNSSMPISHNTVAVLIRLFIYFYFSTLLLAVLKDQFQQQEP